jgi:hypothetical protein
MTSTYTPPTAKELAKLSPAEFAVEWALADDHGAHLAPRTSADYCSLWDAYPERLRRYKPAPEWVEFLRLPSNWGRPPESLPLATQEDFVTTLANHDAFRRAVVAVLLAEGGAA